MAQLIKLNTNTERSRRYIFPDGEMILLTNISGLFISDSGTHYLNCTQGKVIVRKGWLAIYIDMDYWTYPKELNEG
jgi:hypothetical protein